MPIWKSSSPPAEVTPTELGFTPEEAAKMGGLVLVEPAAPGSRMYHYRFYPAGNNQCESDLKKLLDARKQYGAIGPEPYCTDRPTGPPVQGNALIF